MAIKATIELVIILLSLPYLSDGFFNPFIQKFNSLFTSGSDGNGLNNNLSRRSQRLNANDVKDELSKSSISYATNSTCSKPLESIDWKETGYSSWTWRNHKINYVEMGKGVTSDGKEKPSLLLIHGFGASVFHWRYNIPALSKDYHVYAMDMLGFGLSDKPIIEYSPEVWRDQTLDFLREVVEETGGTVVAGNSLGGFTALYAASTSSFNNDDLIKGCVLLNAAGRFKPAPGETVTNKKNPVWLESFFTFFQRLIIRVSFFYTKQPARIAQVLRQVYPVDATNVDDELVKSIQFPSFDPNAAEVFYRVIVKNGGAQPTYVDDCLAALKAPLLLLWGMEDPWIRPGAADKIQALYPNAQRVNINAGHCPHDESPKEVNEALSNFMKSIF